MGKAKNLEERMYQHLHGPKVHFDDCLRWDDPSSNHADNWNLTFWPMPEDQLTEEEKKKIHEKKSHEPNGHNKIN